MASNMAATPLTLVHPSCGRRAMVEISNTLELDTRSSAPIGAAWAEIMEKKKALGELKTQIATEEAAVDAKGVSDSDKQAHKKTIDGLEKQVSKVEKEADKLKEYKTRKSDGVVLESPQRSSTVIMLGSIFSYESLCLIGVVLA